MKSVLAGCMFSLIASTSLLAANGPMGPAQPNWPPAGGSVEPINNPGVNRARPVNALPQGYMPMPGHYYSRPQYARPGQQVLPPSADWPDAAYGYADMLPPPPPGYPVQIVPPPGIPLEGDLMDTTPRPVRHWRPLGP